MLDRLDIMEWLEKNKALQIKKNNLRQEIKEKGILNNKGVNEYDKYKYFSEAQYKELFTELFAKYKLELKVSEVGYSQFEGTEKQGIGRTVSLEFTLIDVETGFFETSVITGEGIDKGDKAIYKAYTGALKYYLANTFMVATQDDPENDKTKPIVKKTYTAGTKTKPTSNKGTISKKQQDILIDSFKDKPKQLQDILKKYGKKTIYELDIEEASEIIETKGEK